MLKRLTLTFQNHREFVIDLARGVTLLLGDNGSGKSAVLRGLRWLAFNEWEGEADGFVPWDSDFASVKLETDKLTVERRKDKTFNGYYLNGSPVRFDTVNRRSVPEIVTNALNLTPDNFQSQLDGAYWLSLTPGQAAKSLNRIVSLEAIDDSLDAAARDVREAKTREKVCLERLTQARQTKEDTDWVPEASEKLCTIEQVEKEMVEKASRIAQGERMLAEARRLGKVRDNALAVAKLGRSARDAAQAMADQADLIERLERTAKEIRTLHERKTWLQKQLDQKLVKLKTLKSRVCPACGQKVKSQ